MKFKILNPGLISNDKIHNYLTIKGLFGFKKLNHHNRRQQNPAET